MILLETLDEAWLKKILSENKITDKDLLEKVIRALLLVEGLAESELDFVFKGGTALMLLLDSMRRFSIDIDISMPAMRNFNQVFSAIVSSREFTRWEQDNRSVVAGIPKAHYKFYYSPVSGLGEREDYILLDILFGDPNYQHVAQFPITSKLLKQEGNPIFVSVPSLSDLLGDKLTAFAPNTTGIRYGAGKEMEIIKQLYDIGSLIDEEVDIELVSSTFHRIARTQLNYRSRVDSTNIVLEDIYQTALHLCMRGMDGVGDFAELSAGVNKVKSFIFSEKYQIDRAITHASKAAYLAKLIESGSPKIEKFTDAARVTDLLIEQPFNTKLNKLKKANPEAFFYWYKIYEMSLLITTA